MGVIITICSLLLFAYIFDVFSSKIRIPTVIILLLTGWLAQEATRWLNIKTPDLSSLLPSLGTIGLILIVLEGSLELDVRRSKIPLILKSGLGSLFSMVVFTAIITLLLINITGHNIHTSIINAIPLAVISSAIAIPSARAFNQAEKEFVIYESSISDILGVLLFTFATLNSSFHLSLIGSFIFQILLMIIISFVFSFLLILLMKYVKHKVKFLPIVIFIILIYSVGKLLHLPSLIFILIFGLILGNFEKFDRISFLKNYHILTIKPEINRFNDIVYEMTFLIRVLFFILFGFLLNTQDIINIQSLYWSLPITGIIYLIRFIQLKVSHTSVKPLIFVAPRGLITILFFLSIPAYNLIPEINKSVITQIILLTSFIIMFSTSKQNKKTAEVITNNHSTTTTDIQQ